MKIVFANGTTAQVPADVQETDKVSVVDRRGNRSEVMWGSIVAQSNGEALRLRDEALARQRGG